jgi:hypothetical protein
MVCLMEGGAAGRPAGSLLRWLITSLISIGLANHVARKWPADLRVPSPPYVGEHTTTAPLTPPTAC